MQGHNGADEGQQPVTAPKKAYDGRTVEARRAKRLTRALEKEYRDAGLEIGLAARNVIDLAVMLRMQVDRVQDAQRRGEAVNGDHVIRMAGTALRVHAETLRQAKARQQAKTQDLVSYIKQKEQHAS